MLHRIRREFLQPSLQTGRVHRLHRVLRVHEERYHREQPREAWRQGVAGGAAPYPRGAGRGAGGDEVGVLQGFVDEATPIVDLAGGHELTEHLHAGLDACESN